MRTLALVDGEHYPPVTRAALEAARARGHEIVAALFVGGTEKLAAGDDPPDLGVTVLSWPMSRCMPLLAAIADSRPEVVLDLSDEPVLGYRERMELIAVALAAGVAYVGPDFRLDPPDQGPPLPRADARRHRHRQAGGQDRDRRAVARLAARRGLEPVVVAMGRGGPPEPTVAMAGSVDLDHLVRLVADGRARGLRLPGGRASPPASRRSAPAAPAAGSPARRTCPTSGRPPSWRPPWAPAS